MMDIMAPKKTIDALVPITRFNRGEAKKIFEEVKESGYKVVVKNNTPTCVLLTPERYERMMEMIIDQYLYELAEEREKNGTGKTYTFDEVLAKDGLTLDDLDAMEDVELE